MPSATEIMDQAASLWKSGHFDNAAEAYTKALSDANTEQELFPKILSNRSAAYMK